MAGVRIDGLREVLRDLQRLGVEAEDLKSAMNKIGNKVVGDAKALTPVLTGRLRDSIRASKAKSKAVIRAGSRSVNYASFVEYGSVHNEQESMVRDAANKNEQYAAQALEQEIDSLIRTYGLN